MKTLRICKKGHKYYKSSDCPTCPKCEEEKKEGVFISLSAPARRALENAGIKTPGQLSKWSENEILKLHGMGPGSISPLKKILKENKLSFKK
jgi:DNA-directed RNA polymerase alpha subunit